MNLTLMPAPGSALGHHDDDGGDDDAADDDDDYNDDNYDNDYDVIAMGTIFISRLVGEKTESKTTTVYNNLVVPLNCCKR